MPLFEKVLSASDAGRIGRLVLPKACAEVFFDVYLFVNGTLVNLFLGFYVKQINCHPVIAADTYDGLGY